MGKKLFVVESGVGSMWDFMEYYLADNISEVLKRTGSITSVEELGNDEYTLNAEQLRDKHLYEVEVTYEISDKTVYVFADGFEHARELALQCGSFIDNGMFVGGRIQYTITPDRVIRIEELPGKVEVI